MADQAELPRPLADVVDTAVGRAHRRDPVLPGSGGPAGNARLTAWTGLTLLFLFAAEGVTLLALGRLLDVHIVLGAALIPPVLLKTASTGWRILRYYGGQPDYRFAGPPPVLLRLLGPLVVLTSLAVLGSGIVLIALGQRASRTALVTVAGQRIDAVTVHKLSFAGWLVIMAVHVLSRTVPAWQIATGRLGEVTRRVAGATTRWALLAGSVIVGVILGWLLLSWASSWRSAGALHHHEEGRAAAHPVQVRPAEPIAAETDASEIAAD